MKNLFLIICLSASLCAQNPDQDGVYKFSGKHFLASYLHCDTKAMCDLQGLMNAMDLAVQSSGATVLDRCSYVFPPHGITIVYLLSESHASLHTYPEFGSCFVDLFTCGAHCSATAFDTALRDYLHPQETDVRYLQRNDQSQEIPFPDRLHNELE
ncbi:MAG TPA: adenosylmethionine decarboxylase [Chlamydiales bacterium]|nr:adenosylmethionine decarboxylase [Chlamydiales bacterium]